MRAFITCLALLFSSLAVAVDSSVPQLYLRGSFNGWTTNQPMYLTSNNTWEATVNASANSEFKFDVSGDWSENYGDDNGDGIAERNGGNIRITQGGYYTVRYHDLTRRYSLLVSTFVYLPFSGYPEWSIAGLPVTVYQDGKYFQSGGISYGKYGNWYTTRLPVGRNYRVVLDATTSNNRYQGEVSFTSAPNLPTQNLAVASCGAVAVRASMGASSQALNCTNGIWSALLSPAGNPIQLLARHNSGDSNDTLYGDDGGDGVVAINEAPLTANGSGKQLLTLDLNSGAYSLSSQHTVTFTTYSYMPRECWLEIRGNKAPLSWDKGLAFDNAAAGLMLREQTLAMAEGDFEYKYTRVCTGGSLSWELGDNRQGAPTDVDYPQF